MAMGTMQKHCPDTVQTDAEFRPQHPHDGGVPRRQGHLQLCPPVLKERPSTHFIRQVTSTNSHGKPAGRTLTQHPSAVPRPPAPALRTTLPRHPYVLDTKIPGCPSDWGARMIPPGDSVTECSIHLVTDDGDKPFAVGFAEAGRQGLVAWRAPLR
ncbi:hypothetical protein OG894_00815 [Streptomyces sp. NBC_01724]|uniref:hypothetical protein n=1 Tax=Streptomyces sp. NBC_01724 TaxID=2975922 RepID=UPI002E33F289|nr:hypothetical protein [Streptomyces sp. NBC_01724]